MQRAVEVNVVTLQYDYSRWESQHYIETSCNPRDSLNFPWTFVSAENIFLTDNELFYLCDVDWFSPTDVLAEKLNICVVCFLLNIAYCWIFKVIFCKTLFSQLLEFIFF